MIANSSVLIINDILEKLENHHLDLQMKNIIISNLVGVLSYNYGP